MNEELNNLDGTVIPKKDAITSIITDNLDSFGQLKRLHQIKEDHPAIDYILRWKMNILIKLIQMFNDEEIEYVCNKYPVHRNHIMYFRKREINE